MTRPTLDAVLSPNFTSPATGGLAVTPSNSVDLSTVGPTRALWVGAGGDVKVDFADGTTVTLVGVPTGTLLPIRTWRVYATGTTATSIVALF